ncbi:APC family permease [Saccharothrix luteola]|uniref:APC family permease n=1 Tax=Saccharothrix luteola TaxID=2893018 RepID=UPI001E62A1FA|nr:amino acid permease [Saccharothrix luteola]MCC8245463.1 amino acid permease [Saccharothrix luteola]
MRLTAMYVGAVLGPGVLVLPALATEAAGPASLLAWVALLALSVPVAVSFARLGEQHRGGVVGFVRTAFGERAARPVAWWFYLVGVPFGVLGGALVGGRYVAHALGGGDPAVIAIVLLAAAFAANYAGLRVSAGAQVLLVGLLAVLLAVAVAGTVPTVSRDDFEPFAPHGWLAVGHAAVVLFFAFSGWEAAGNLADEFGDPRRATRRTLVVVAVLYLGLAVTTAGTTSDVPLADLLERVFGPSARLVTAVAATLLAFGAINTYLAGGARLGGRHGLTGLLVVCALLTAVTLRLHVELDTLMRVASTTLAAVAGGGGGAPPPPRRGPTAPGARGGPPAGLAFSGVLLAVPLVIGVAALVSARVGSAVPAGRSSS